MMVSKQTLIGVGLSVVGSALLTPVLLQLNFLHDFLVYSIFSRAENLFLLCTLSLYAASSSYFSWYKHRKFVHASANIAFFIVALQGVMVMGLASFALLWVIPMCLYHFSEPPSVAA